MSAESPKFPLPESRKSLKIIAVTPDNINQLSWDHLDWLPYFDGLHTYGQVDYPGLLPSERFDILVPANIVTARIAAAAKLIEPQIRSSIQPWAIGAVLNAGLPLYQEILGLLPLDCQNKLITEAHIDIKSRRGTDIQNRGYQINQMPDPRKINDLRFLICEGVADTGQTLRLIDNHLIDPRYRRVQPLGLLIIDKNSAHPGVGLPSWVLPPLFRVNGQIWVSGRGMDVDNRGRDLKDIVAYRRV